MSASYDTIDKFVSRATRTTVEDASVVILPFPEADDLSREAGGKLF